MKEILEKHLRSNGLLIGVSAGAIALTPDIGTSAFCGDSNVPALVDLSGMSFVDFCFLPHLETHFKNTKENLLKAQEYATRMHKDLFISKDSDGIFVDGSGQLTLYGDFLQIKS